MREPIHRTSLYIPIGLWKKVRELVFDQNRTFNSLTIKALEAIYGGEK